MGIAAILFNCAELVEQIVNTLLTECSMWNLVKIAQAVSLFYKCIYPSGKGTQNLRGHNLDSIKTVLLL